MTFRFKYVKKIVQQVKDYNILFIDSPVGTGFSNVNTENKLARTEQQVINDLIILIEQFFMKFSILSKVQTYIVGTCYGGRTAAALAYEWIQVKKLLLYKNYIKNSFILKLIFEIFLYYFERFLGFI